MLCNNISRVLDAVRSRTLPVRVAAPSEADICDLLQHVAEKGAATNFFISGAGAFGTAYEMEVARLRAQGVVLGETHKPRGIKHPEGREWDGANWGADGPGFLSITLDGDLATAQFVYHNGTVIYSAQFNSTA